MNPPATALIWEIWRKNRSGFAALVLLFAVCAGLTALTNYRTEIGREAEVESRPLGEANLIMKPRFSPLRDRPDGSGGFVVQLNLGATTLYRGPFTNAVVWSAVPSHPGWIRITMGVQTVFEGNVGPSPWLHWSTIDLGTGRVDGGSYQIKLRRSEPAGHQFTTAEGISNYGPTWIAIIWSQWGLPWSSVLFAFSVLAVLAIFAGAEPSAARGFTGIPPRRFALPVRTGVLVGVPILLGGATISILVLAWSRFVLRPLVSDEIGMPTDYLMLTLLASLVVFQAVVWGLPSFPRIRVALIAALILGLIPLTALPFSMPPETWRPWQQRLEIVDTIAWLGGIAAAGWGVRQQRRGGWAGWQGGSRIVDWLCAIRPRPLEFWSPLAAQFWIEWRRNCRVPLLLWVLLVWLPLGAAYARCSIHNGSILTMNDPVVGVVTLLASLGSLGFVVMTGLNLARDGTSKQLALSSFTATRPVGAGDLLLAKILAGVSAWFVAVMILVASAAMAEVLSGEYYEWNLPVALQLVLSLNLLIGILPLGLTGKISGFPWSLLPLVLIYGVLFNGFAWVDRHHAYRLLFAVLLVIFLVKLVLAYWGFRRSLGLRLVTPRFVAVCGGLWLFVTLLLVRLACARVERADFAGEMLFLIPAAALVLPLARIALSPLALAMNRHR